jgi:hypothetical protein
MRKGAKGAKGERVISTKGRNLFQIPLIHSGGQVLACHFAFLAAWRENNPKQL